MKKLAIIVDSFVGQEKKAVEKNKDFYFVPMKAILNDKEYLDGQDIPHKDLLRLTYVAKTAKTSQPSPATLVDYFDKLSKTYEQVIYFPLSGSLSGTERTATTFANEYKNVYVVPQIFVGDTSIVFGKHAQDMYKKDGNINKILNWLNKRAFEFPTYVVPMTNDAIIRGGRLGKTAATILQKFKTVPIIGLENNEKLKRKMIKRSGSKAVKWAIEKMVKEFEKDMDSVEWFICHNINDDNAVIAEKIIRDAGYNFASKQLTSGTIAIHTGDGAISISIRRIIK